MDHDQAEALTAEQLAARLELAILDPQATTEQVAGAYRAAAAAGLGAVIVRPSDVDVCARYASASTTIAAVCGYPYGWQPTGVKAFETRDLIRRGARRVDVVVNIGKLQSREFQYVEMELIQLAQACHEGGAKLRAIFQSHLLGEEQKLVGTKIAKRSETDEALASLDRASSEDEEVLLRKCQPFVTPVGQAKDLDSVLDALRRGFGRAIVPEPFRVLAEYRARLEALQGAT